MCGVRLNERPKKKKKKKKKTPCNTKGELKARITAEFTNLNNETVGKVCRRFRSRLEAVVEANGDFFISI